MKDRRGHRFDTNNEDAICAACEVGRWEVEDPDGALCPVLTVDGHVFSPATNQCWKCGIHRRYVGDDDPGCAVDLRLLADERLGVLLSAEEENTRLRKRSCDGKGCYDGPSRSASSSSLEGGVESRGVLAPGEGSALGMVPGPVLSLVRAALLCGTRAKVLGPWIPCRVDLHGKTAHCRRDLSGAMVAVCNEDSDRARIDAGCRADGWVLTECDETVLRVALPGEVAP